MIYDFLYPVAAFCLAVLGSYILWKYYGSRIVMKYATEAFFTGIEQAFKDQEPDPNKMCREKRAVINLMQMGIEVAIAAIPPLITAEVPGKAGSTRVVFKLHPNLKLLAQGGRRYLQEVMTQQVNQFTGGMGKGLNKIKGNIVDNPMFKMLGVDEKTMKDLAPYFEMFGSFSGQPGQSSPGTVVKQE